MKKNMMLQILCVIVIVIVVFLCVVLLVFDKHRDAAGEKTAEKTGVTKDQAEVTLGNYKGIAVSVENPEVTDEDVEEGARLIIDAYNATAQSDKTVVEKGDTVMCAIHGELDDGTEFEDESEGFIIPGSGNTYPEIEQALPGMKTGETKTVSVVLPDPYESNTELSGKTVSMDVTVQYIRSEEELSLDTLTDIQAAVAFREDGVDDLESFYQKVRETVTETKQNEMRSEAYHKICDHLLTSCSVEPFPDAEFEKRMDEQIEQTRYLCETYYGMSMEDYLKQFDTTEDSYREANADKVRDTIKLELIFTAIGDKEGITYPEEEFDTYIENVLADSIYETKEDLFAAYGEDYVKTTFRIEHVVNWLIDNADISWTEPAVADEDPASAEEGILDDGADIGVEGGQK